MVSRLFRLNLNMPCRWNNCSASVLQIQIFSLDGKYPHQLYINHSGPSTNSVDAGPRSVIVNRKKR